MIATTEVALEQFGKIDVLVNDAGIIGVSQWWERETPSDEDWAQVYAVNVRGMVITSEIVSENMKARNFGKDHQHCVDSGSTGQSRHPSLQRLQSRCGQLDPIQRRSACAP